MVIIVTIHITSPNIFYALKKLSSRLYLAFFLIIKCYIIIIVGEFVWIKKVL